MTIKRDLKRLIRARQQRTGESYTTARMNLLSPSSQKPLLVELYDVTERARAIGFACCVSMSPALEADCDALLQQLMRILELPGEGARKMRTAMREGTGMPGGWSNVTRWRGYASDAVSAYADELRAGLRGFGLDGMRLAFDASGDGRTVLVALQPRLGRLDTLILWPLANADIAGSLLATVAAALK